MSLEESRAEAYKRIKKRLGDYRYRSGFLTIGTMVFAVMLILSVFPLVPAIISGLLGLINSGEWLIGLWFLCVFGFGALFWVFQRFSRRIEEKRGITLEEKLYVPAYEALGFLKECFDPNHPILSSRTKAIRRLQNMDEILGATGFSNTSLIKEEMGQLAQLRGNLNYWLIPSIKKPPQNDTKVAETPCSAVEGLVDYLYRPELAGLIALNRRMSSLPKTTERGVLEDFSSAIFRRSNLRHVGVFSVFAIFASLVYYAHISYFGATMDSAFNTGLMFYLGIAAIYVAYLGLTRRRESRT